MTRPRAAVMNRATEAETGELASLIVHGHDRNGIVSAVSTVLASHGANIVSLDQYSDNPKEGSSSSAPSSLCRT
jgi:formyltetrahydrofolate deformylase